MSKPAGSLDQPSCAAATVVEGVPVITDSPFGRDAVAGLLSARGSRAPEYEEESRVLVHLGKLQVGSRDVLLQAISDAALLLCRAGSSGISLLETSEEMRQFRWLAASGASASFGGKVTAWDECPCGIAVASNAPTLFVDPQRDFPCLNVPELLVTEGLVVPIPGDGDTLGAIWVMSHSSACRFDLEDVRLLTDLAVFAGGALTVSNARTSSEQGAKRQDEFIAMLGHELRNPMAPVDSAIAAATRLCRDNEEAVKVLTIAQRQMGHLRTLVDDLLDAARMEHGKLVIRKKEAPLNQIISDAIATVRHQIDIRRHILRVSGLELDIMVVADHVRLTQVFGNILSNAVKYTPEGGAISLRVEAQSRDVASSSGKIVVIEVQDNGIGILKDVQPYVFDLFAQSSRGLQRADGGLGIGLAVAKRLIELHGGEISLHSDGAGRGTLVTMCLPILEGKSAEGHAASSEPPGPLAPTRILLVDDNSDALETLKTLLELDGHTVSVAESGREGLRKLTEWRPQVAVVDIGMSDINGYEVARTIRLDARLDGVVLVALTGYAGKSDKLKARECGFDYHLSKPLPLEELRRILSLSHRGLLD